MKTFNIKIIKHYLNNDPFIYWCILNDIQTDSENYLMKHFKTIKQELYKQLLDYHKNKNVLNCENNNYSIEHILKYNNYDVIYKPMTIYKNFENNDAIFIKNEYDKYDIIIPTTKSTNDTKYYTLLASFYKFSIKTSYTLIDTIYFLPLQENYLNKSKWFSYKINENEKNEFDFKIDSIYSIIINSKNLIIGETIFPNMKNKEDYPYHNYKNQIALICDEITQYYYCNHVHRNYYIKYNKNKEYSSKNFGIKNVNTNTAKLRDTILKNRHLKNNEIKKNNFKLNKDIVYLFIDFEVLPKIPLDVSNLNEMTFINGIYNIGIYIKTYESENFISLYSDSLDDQKIVNEFINILDSYYNKNLKCNIYHWTSAEITFLKQYQNKYNVDLNLDKYNFIDLYKIFIEKKINVNGIKSFKLKNIIDCIGLNKNKEEDIKDGIETISLYLYDYINNTNLSKKDIQKYNEYDCKYLYDILQFI